MNAWPKTDIQTRALNIRNPTFGLDSDPFLLFHSRAAVQDQRLPIPRCHAVAAHEGGIGRADNGDLCASSQGGGTIVGAGGARRS